MEKDILSKLREGYKKLITFESRSGGFTWFGGGVGWDGMTAFGLRQFCEMKTVGVDVNEAMMQRNYEWLYNKRSGSGTFDVKTDSYDAFARADRGIADAYIVQVLTEHKKYSHKDLLPEFERLKKLSCESEDPYLMALISAAFFNVGDTQFAMKISDRLSEKQSGGSVKGAKSSITNSRGKDLVTETTALAVINWLNQDEDKYHQEISQGVFFLQGQAKDFGAYGATQATILALEAFVKMAESESKKQREKEQ